MEQKRKQKFEKERPKIDITTLMYGKVPPQAREIEEAVIGACMLQAEALDTCLEILKPENFYVENHQKLFKIFVEHVRKAYPVDMLTVIESLKAKEELDLIGGPFAIVQFTKNVVSTAHIETHCKIILQKFIQRELIKICGDTIAVAYDDAADAFEVLDQHEKDLILLTSSFTKKDFKTSEIVATEAMERIDHLRNHKDELSGTPTGYPYVNNLTNGWQDTDLIILAARPAVGKTAFALNLAINAAKDINKATPVGFFSLEMSSGQLANRALSIISRIGLKLISRGRLYDDDYEKVFLANVRFGELPILIDDTASLSLLEFRSKARRMKNKHNVGLIIIDYLQLMSGSGSGNREQEISAISRGLKSLAKEIQVPIIALSQLSRAVETRKGDPVLSDLRECLSTETSFIYGSNFIQHNFKNKGKLLSLNRSNNVVMKDSIDIPKTENYVFRLKLKSGRYIDATENHNILTSDGYKPLSQILSTDSIACALNFNNENGVKIKEARFIGWMIGNGCMYGYNVPSFTTPDEIIAKEFLLFCNEYFGFEPKVHKHWSGVYQYDITKNSVRTPEGNPVTNWLKEKDLWGKKAPDKTIPDWFIETADNESICELLAGLWDTDGSIAGKDRIVLKYSTTSKVLAIQVIYLLAKVGIFSYLDDGYMSERANYKCFQITINDAEMQGIFKSKISLLGKKGAKLNDISVDRRQSYQGNKIGLNTSILIGQEISKAGVSKEKWRHQNNRRLTKKYLHNGLKMVEIKSKAIYQKYIWLTSENIYWDSVESIEGIGAKKIFDRSVPGTNNFIVNGIIVHNSGAIEQDADVVMFLFREDYQKLDGEIDQEVKGDAFLKFAKHRNGELEKMLFKTDLSIQTFFDADQYQKFTGVQEPVKVAAPHQPLTPLKQIFRTSNGFDFDKIPLEGDEPGY